MAGYGATLLAALGYVDQAPRPGQALWSGAILAGVIYTFAPFHFAHLLGHMQVFSLEFIPFYVLYLLLRPDTGQGHDSLAKEFYGRRIPDPGSAL